MRQTASYRLRCLTSTMSPPPRTFQNAPSPLRYRELSINRSTVALFRLTGERTRVSLNNARVLALDNGKGIKHDIYFKGLRSARLQSTHFTLILHFTLSQSLHFSPGAAGRGLTALHAGFLSPSHQTLRPSNWNSWNHGRISVMDSWVQVKRKSPKKCYKSIW